MNDEGVAPAAAGTETEAPSSIPASSARHRRWPAPLIVTSIVILFYLPGLRWGLPGAVSWSQDTIAGARTLGAFDQWPQKWAGRYAPLQYLILRGVYEPFLQHWDATGQLDVDPATGRISLAQPHAPKIGLLVLIARVVTVAMAAACGLGIWAAARAFGADELASGLATAAFMTGAAFSYFAHLGNVDVPSICWFAWSLYAFGRLLDTGAMRFALLLGLFGTLAISTKDATAGLYPGMALVLIVVETYRRARAQPLVRSLFGAVFQVKWLVGLTVFVVPYLALYGAFSDWDAYWVRMTYWLDPPLESLHAKQLRYGGQLELLTATVRYAAGAVGWPMLVAMFFACGDGLVRRRRLALALLVPAAGYYLLVICKIEFVYSRFLFAPLLLMSILLGLTFADLLRRIQWSPVYRYGLALIVFLPTFAYAWAVDAEMLADSRYRAEAWFRENVPLSGSVGAFSHPQYLPRLHDMGYATYPVEMRRASFDRPQPDYLLLTNYNYEDFDEPQHACLRELLDGMLGYERAADFEGRFLGSWLGLAGRGAPKPGKISPTLIVLRRSGLR